MCAPSKDERLYPELPRAPCLLRLVRAGVRLLPWGRPLVGGWFSPPFARRGPYLASFDGGSLVFTTDLADCMSRYVFFDGSWEPVTTAVFIQMVRPGQVILDVGAHLGYFSLLAGRRNPPPGRIIAFEPDPTHAARLRENISRNGIGNITVEPLAIAEASLDVVLDRGDEGNTSTERVLARRDAAVGGTIVEAKAVSLDDYCRGHGLEQVDIVKMDIEGGEAEAIRGMARGLECGLYRRILLELHPTRLRPRDIDPRGVIAGLRQRGYRCWRLLSRPDTLRGRYKPAFRRSLLVPFDDVVPAPPSHFLFLAAGVPEPS